LFQLKVPWSTSCNRAYAQTRIFLWCHRIDIPSAPCCVGWQDYGATQWNRAFVCLVAVRWSLYVVPAVAGVLVLASRDVPNKSCSCRNAVLFLGCFSGTWRDSRHHLVRVCTILPRLPIAQTRSSYPVQCEVVVGIVATSPCCCDATGQTVPVPTIPRFPDEVHCRDGTVRDVAAQASEETFEDLLFAYKSRKLWFIN